jgi:hypothetical protein
MQRDGRSLWRGLSRRFALSAVLTLAGALVLAHSAPVADHMGEAVAVCVAVADTAGLALLTRTAARPRALGPGTRAHDGSRAPDPARDVAAERPAVGTGKSFCVAGPPLVRSGRIHLT